MILPVIAALCVCYVSGYPWGAPPSACEDMMPSHNDTEPQNSSSPFTVTTSSPTYMAGQTINVTLTATGNENYFEGFMIQARHSVNTPSTVGILNADSNNFAQDQNCANMSSLTHTNKTNSMNSTHKTELTVTWTAPDTNQGNVYFVATFVQHFDTFWCNVSTADPLVFYTTTTTATSTTSPTNTTATNATTPTTTTGAAGHVTTSLAFILSCVLYNFL